VWAVGIEVPALVTKIFTDAGAELAPELECMT
jgi:hypothetical protein